MTGGYSKAFSTIIDANLTTLITASILIWLGTGPVKGFGITLAIGIATSVFCALFVSRLFLSLLLKSGINNLISLQQIQKSDPKDPIDFHRYRKIAFLASWIIVGIGIFSTFSKKDTILGIDFRGGEELVAGFSQTIDAGDLEQSFKSNPELGEVQHVYRSEIGSGEASSRLVLQTEEGKSRDALSLLQTQYPDANLVEEGLSNIGGSVSEQIKSDAILSVL